MTVTRGEKKLITLSEEEEEYLEKQLLYFSLASYAHFLFLS